MVFKLFVFIEFYKKIYKFLKNSFLTFNQTNATGGYVSANLNESQVGFTLNTIELYTNGNGGSGVDLSQIKSVDNISSTNTISTTTNTSFVQASIIFTPNNPTRTFTNAFNKIFW